MNILKLKIATQERVEYFYIPEGKGNPGEIGINIGDDKADVILRAENDNSAEHYGFKAAKAVTRCVVSKKNLPLEFINAWG
jgi:hypothetical protein